MSATFSTCMYCACNEDGVAVYKCYECREIYCGICAEHGFFGTKCPACDSRNSKKLGYIKDRHGCEKRCVTEG